MAQFSLSPSVEVKEFDFSQTVPAVATSIGAYAGSFQWGPVESIVAVADEDELVTVFGLPSDTNAADWFSAANFLSYSNYLKTVRVVGGSALNAVATGGAVLVKNDEDFNGKVGTLTGNKILAKYPGVLGNSLKVSYADRGAFATWAYRAEFSSAGSAVVSTKTYTLSGVTANVTTGSDLLTSVNDTSSFRVGMEVSGAGIPASTTVLAVVNDSTVQLSAVATADGTAEAITGTASVTVTTFSGQPNTSDHAADLGGSDDEIHFVVVDEDGLFSGTKGTVLEKFAYLSKAVDGKSNDGATSYFMDVINRNSNYVYVTDAALEAGWGAASSTAFTPMTAAVSHSLDSGADGTAVTDADRIVGYALYRDAEVVDVSLVFAGPGGEAVCDYLIDNIGEYRRDCVVFVSPPQAAVVNNAGQEEKSIIDFRNKLNSSTYAVMDSGWKYQYDRYSDKYRWVPLNADVAGLCANVDNVRDPWFSPAGFNRGYVKNVIKLAYNPVKKATRDNLYQLGVNSVVSFTGQGTVLFGDRTLTSKTSAFQYINVRRLFIMIEKAIATFSKFVMFEFNDETTRSQFVNTVVPYLRDIQGRRGIFDFAVDASERVNTPEVIDSAGFVANILVKPSRSINFVRLNFAALKTGTSFEEIELR